LLSGISGVSLSYRNNDRRFEKVKYFSSFSRNVKWIKEIKDPDDLDKCLELMLVLLK
jgi:hypothetical protein